LPSLKFNFLHLYCEKGTKVYIEGELQTNKYKDKTTGEEKYSTQVVVSGFNNVFLIVKLSSINSQLISSKHIATINDLGCLNR
jgi:single-stranded DNA-binding protein